MNVVEIRNARKTLQPLALCLLLVVALAPLAVPEAQARRHRHVQQQQVQEEQPAAQSDADSSAAAQSDESSSAQTGEADQTGSSDSERPPVDPYARPAGTVSLASVVGNLMGSWFLIMLALCGLVGGNCLVCAIVWHASKALRGGQKPQVG